MLITNFASGELSQNLNGRVDLPQYYQGAAKIENFDIIPTGGIKRRVGTERVAELSGNNRIIPFIVNKNSVYILEIAVNPDYDIPVADPVEAQLSNYYIKNNNGTFSKAQSFSNNTTYYLLENTKHGLINIWKEQVLGGYAKFETPIYTDWGNLTAIKELHYAQNYDTIIFTHKDYPPFILKMRTSNIFEGSEMQFDFTPDIILDDDDEQVMNCANEENNLFPIFIEQTSEFTHFTYYKLVNGAAQNTDKYYRSGIKDFYCAKKGKLWKWNANAGLSGEWEAFGTDLETDEELFRTTNKYPACCAYFNNRLFFAGTNEKPQMVWASAAPDTYENRYNQFSTYKKYVTVNKVVKDADLHVFTADLAFANIDTVANTTTFTNLSQDFTVTGTLANNIQDYYITCDFLPAEVKVVSVTSNTLTVNSSKVSIDWEEGETTRENLVLSIQLWKRADTASNADYEYKVVANNVTTADCALFFELASDQNDSIKFLSSNQFLTIGTESSVWSVASSITALNVIAQMQGRYGSDDLQGQAVETATVYFAQGKKGIREFYYNSDSAVNAFQTNNIALLADHVLRESAAVDFDYMTNPYSRLMVVRADGVCVTMLYDKTNGIMAWSRIKLQNGLIRNCAVTRGKDESDLVFFVVQDGQRYFLEVLDMGSEIYLDSRKLYDSTALSPTDSYTEGAVLFNQTQNKTCPIDDIPQDFISQDDVVYIGYTYKSYIKSMPVINNDVSGRRRITALQVRFLNSYLPVMKCTGVSDEKFTTIKTKPYSGIGKITYPGSTDYDVTFELEAEDPQPVNILSVDALTA